MELDKKTTRRIAFLIAFALILAWAINNMEQVQTAISWFLQLVSPLLLGFCLAFLLNIMLRPLELLWDRIFKKSKSAKPKKLKRPFGLVISILILIGLISSFFLVLIPQIRVTFQSIAQMLPDFTEDLEAWWGEISIFLSEFGASLPELDMHLEEIFEAVTTFLTEKAGAMVSKTLDVTISVFSVIFNLVLAFIFSFYMLSKKEEHGRHARRAVRAVLKPQTADRVLDIVSLVGRSFKNYVTAQLTEAVILGSLCFVGMLIFRLPYAPVVSVVIGFTALIPIFGAWFGAIIGAFLIVVVDPMKALWFIVFLILLQQFEGNIIAPKVVGRSVGLPGLWVLAAVTIGGSAFGIMGMILGVPIVAVLYSLGREFIHARTAAIPDSQL